MVLGLGRDIIQIVSVIMVDLLMSVLAFYPFGQKRRGLSSF